MLWTWTGCWMRCARADWVVVILAGGFEVLLSDLLTRCGSDAVEHLRVPRSLYLGKQRKAVKCKWMLGRHCTGYGPLCGVSTCKARENTSFFLVLSAPSGATFEKSRLGGRWRERDGCGIVLAGSRRQHQSLDQRRNASRYCRR